MGFFVAWNVFQLTWSLSAGSPGAVRGVVADGDLGLRNQHERVWSPHQVKGHGNPSWFSRNHPGCKLLWFYTYIEKSSLIATVSDLVHLLLQLLRVRKVHVFLLWLNFLQLWMFTLTSINIGQKYVSMNYYKKIIMEENKVKFIGRRWMFKL